MGKKKVIKKSKEELLEERETIEEKMKKDVKIKKSKRIRKGRIYINSSYNNTSITLTDENGNVLTWATAGSLGFKGTKKATPFAASKVASKVCETAKNIGIEEVGVYVKGIGSGRDSAIRSLTTHGLELTSIKDVTPIPHNGCRPPKPRRV